MSAPDVSVVVCASRQPARLAFALEGLAEQTITTDRFEVITAGPGSSERITAMFTEELDGRFVAAPRGVAARNAGWRRSRAPLVAFLDEDCRPAPDWLERLLEAAGEPRILLEGRTDPDPDEAHLDDRPDAHSGSGPVALSPHRHLACPRPLLERLGGFDTRFRGGGAADADLRLRAAAARAELRFVPEAIVWHPVSWRSLRHGLGAARRNAVIPALVARHPGLRRTLWLGLFQTRDHLLLLGALAGVLALRNRPLLAGIAAYPYLSRQVDPGRLLGARLARFPARVALNAVVDVAEIAALAGASVRNRTLVL